MEPDAGVRAANEALMYDDAKLVVVFCWQSYDLPELLAQIRACSSGAPVIGCATEVVRGAYGFVGAGVPLVVLSIS
ncbi:MAG: FIST N-terminal domain-containing protein [Pseudonocardiaceae bacterium]